MKQRLNGVELDARIYSFLHRKFSEFPELRGEPSSPAPIEARRRIGKE